MERKQISSGAKWENIVGYSRAVKVGPHIEISGTTATDESGNIVGSNDVYAQTIQTLKNIEKALKSLGGELRHITRTRIYVTDISNWEKIAKAHQEILGKIKPATSMIEVSRLISPEILVEIEAQAIVHE